MNVSVSSERPAGRRADVKEGWMGRAGSRLCRVVVIVLLASGLTHAAVAVEDETTKRYRDSYVAEAAGDLAAAVAALRQVPVERRHDYFYQLRLGWLLYLNAEHEASTTAYRRALALEPDAVEPRLGLLLPLMAQRRWEEAEEVARSTLAIDARSYLAGSRLAFILFNQGRYAEAIARYRGLIELYPADLEMRAGLGWSLARAGKSREAIAEFEAIIAVAPAYQSALEGLQYARSNRL